MPSETDWLIARQISDSHLTQELARAVSDEIGPHPIASPAMQQAVAQIADRFRALGLSAVHLEEVPFHSWTCGTSELMLDGSPVAHLPFSFTRDADVEGPLVDVGHGDPAAWSALGARARGSVALVRYSNAPGSPTPWFPTDKVLLAERHGARAVVFVPPYPDEMCRPYGGRLVARAGEDCPLPVVSTSGLEGARLAEQAGKALRLTLAGGRSEPALCHNVAGDLGPPEAGEYYLVTAHLDTVYSDPGGLDNTSGVACLAEIAAALSTVAGRLRRRIRFVALTGEEEGFVGSLAYARAHAAELGQIPLQVNMDSIFRETAEGLAVHYMPELIPCFQRMLAEAGQAVQVREWPSVTSDYLPFTLLGVPTVRPADFHGKLPPWSHCGLDTAAKVEVKHVKATATYLAQLLFRLASAPEDYPGRRRPPAEIRAALQRWGVAELAHVAKVYTQLQDLIEMANKADGGELGKQPSRA